MYIIPMGLGMEGSSSSSGEKINWVVEIDEEAKLLDPNEKQHWSKQTIYHIPEFAKKLKGEFFEPRVVSLGPYHHGKDQLEPLESHKRRALVHLVKRSGKSVGSFLDAMDKVAVELQECYHKLGDEWKQDRDRFVKLMLLDGSFMLEILRSPGVAKAPNPGYTDDDPVFSKSVIHKLAYIRRDMLLLENQLPLLALKTIMQVEGRNTCTGIDIDDKYINGMVFRFLGYEGSHGVPEKLGLHALHLSRENLLQQKPDPARGAAQPERDEHMRPASKLQEAGIRFKRSSTSSLRDISFQGDILGDILRLPHIVIDDATEFLFLNVIAFEHLHAGVGNEVSSYVAFMDLIIDTAEDVGLLLEAKIIHNVIGSDEAVAKLFNGLAREVTIDPSSALIGVKKSVNAYYEQPCHRWMAYLRHTYFRSPWALMSLLAAFVLLVMTLLQTYYTMYPYYHPNDSSSPPPASH